MDESKDAYMNYIQEKSKLWVFPEAISYENVPGYLSSFKRQKGFSEIVLDLSKTITFHSSFIGFLLHIKQMGHKKDVSIKLVLSPSAINTLKMLNLYDFLTADSKEYRKFKQISA